MLTCTLTVLLQKQNRGNNWCRGAYWNEGAYSMGAFTNKYYLREVLIGKRVLNQIITVHR